MPRSPSDELEQGRAFYAGIAPDLDVSHFGAMWHIFTVGHLVATNLDRIARRYGVSIADLHLLGTLRIERPEPMRATDLARTLYVSHAVLSARIAKLERMGLLVRAPSSGDRRAFALRLSDEGARKAEAAIADISRHASFVRHYHRLPAADQATLARIMGDLHDRLDRDFIPAARWKL